MAKITFTPHNPDHKNMTVKQEYHRANSDKYKNYLKISVGFNILLFVINVIRILIYKH